MNFKYLQGWMILALILSTLLAIAGNPYHPKFSIYNEGEMGASKFRAALDDFDYNISRMLISPIILDADKSIDTIIIIGSERKYTSAEIDAYEGFVDRGGMLIIFEDFGPAKSIASKMGIKFLPGVLRETFEDLQVNRPTQMFIQDLIFSQMLEDFIFPPLIVSEAVALLDLMGFAEGITLPLLMTFPTAFLDINDNNVMEATDLYSPIGMPVGLMKLYGNGTLMVFGDSSLPLNRYWQKHMTLFGQDYVVSNALWLLLMITSMLNTFGRTSIVFDESHQEINMLSAAGLFNLVAGTWVGILNTVEVTVVLTLITVLFTSNRVREKVKRQRRYLRARETNISQVVEDKPFEKLTGAESSIIQQYILFQVMKENFIQVANSNLIENLENTGKADEFLDKMKIKYGVSALDQPMSFDKLLDLHNDLRQFVDDWSFKWLQ